ncbi:MAG: phenylphosphate carboxylase subunit gamma [Deltaproteobacteria bacterium]|nr:phenylphosphate carboxylase subunit gamma [Deltaproteobacteria bacterium]
MAGKEYDTFFLTDPAQVPRDTEMEMILRDLTPSDIRYKYRSFFAKAMISENESAYPNRLWVRLGRGQLLEKPWSVKVLKEVDKFSGKEGSS